jgi:CelD/BcsL family acetyltransferase involved in cellulose biosynthesis
VNAVLLECARSWEEASSFDWDAMAERSGSVFGTWEWAAAWWEHHGHRGGRPFVTACRRPGGERFALLPLYVWSRPGLRVLRLVGHGPADQLGPLCLPADRPAAAAGLRQALSAAPADLLYAEDVPRAEAWSEPLGAAVVRTTASPTLVLRGGWDEYLSARSRNFRETVRRRERSLRLEGLRFRRCEDPGRLEQDLDLLFALHRRRWAGVETPFGRLEAFHRRFARAALERGWLRLWFLEAAGREVAALYNLRFAGVESYYQAGRDPAWDRSAVGFVLLAHAVRDAFEDGMVEFRFGRGDEPYKRRFTGADPQLETLLVAHGTKGRFALSAAGAARGSTRARRFMRETLRVR